MELPTFLFYHFFIWYVSIKVIYVYIANTKWDPLVFPALQFSDTKTNNYGNA